MPTTGTLVQDPNMPQSIDIFAPPPFVVFNNHHGGQVDRDYAIACGVKEGTVYTLDHLEIHGWHTSTYLKEFPSKSFNSCCFSNAP